MQTRAAKRVAANCERVQLLARDDAAVKVKEFRKESKLYVHGSGFDVIAAVSLIKIHLIGVVSPTTKGGDMQPKTLECISPPLVVGLTTPIRWILIRLT